MRRACTSKRMTSLARMNRFKRNKRPGRCSLMMNSVRIVHNRIKRKARTKRTNMAANPNNK
jgi:hypothetical protein